MERTRTHDGICNWLFSPDVGPRERTPDGYERVTMARWNDGWWYAYVKIRPYIRW